MKMGNEVYSSRISELKLISKDSMISNSTTFGNLLELVAYLLALGENSTGWSFVASDQTG